jgi:hypothetical protein
MIIGVDYATPSVFESTRERDSLGLSRSFRECAEAGAFSWASAA